MAQGPGQGAITRAKALVASVGVLSAFLGVATAFAVSHTVSTVAGDGTEGTSGDGGQATLAGLRQPEDVSLLPDGGFLVADTQRNRIRKVSPDGIITTVAGTGNAGSDGDGGLAVDAELDAPSGVAALETGGFLVADTENARIREVEPDGTITTVAGESGPSLDHPRAVAPLVGGGFLIADSEKHQIRHVDSDGNHTVVAGTGNAGYTGDGGPATSAELDAPYDVAPLPTGGFLIADHDKQVVRRVSPLGIITTVAGGGSDSSTDGILATDAKLDNPAGLVPLLAGGFLVAVQDGHVVRRVDPTGTIETIAGTGSQGFSGDDGPPLEATFNGPMGIAFDEPEDRMLIADSANNRVREIALTVSDPPPDDPDDPGEPDPPRDEPGRRTEPAATEREREAAKPELGRSVAVVPARGRILIRLPGRNRFAVLSGTDKVPVGSTIDTRRGTVALSSALDSRGRTQTARFRGGVFQVRQSRSGRGMTDIILRGPRPQCGARAKASISKRRKRRRGSRLWAKDRRGRFRTRGGNSVATTRGTHWLTEERCLGTLTKVFEGAVSVRNRHSGRKVTVRAGKSYLARRKR